METLPHIAATLIMYLVVVRLEFVRATDHGVQASRVATPVGYE